MCGYYLIVLQKIEHCILWYRITNNETKKGILFLQLLHRWQHIATVKMRGRKCKQQKICQVNFFYVIRVFFVQNVFSGLYFDTN